MSKKTVYIFVVALAVTLSSAIASAAQQAVPDVKSSGVIAKFKNMVGIYGPADEFKCDYDKLVYRKVVRFMGKEISLRSKEEMCSPNAGKFCVTPTAGYPTPSGHAECLTAEMVEDAGTCAGLALKHISFAFQGNIYHAVASCLPAGEELVSGQTPSMICNPENGKCISKNDVKCVDPDELKPNASDKYTTTEQSLFSGYTVFLTGSGEVKNSYDYCKSGYLVENYCDGEVPKSVIVDCKTAFGEVASSCVPMENGGRCSSGDGDKDGVPNVVDNCLSYKNSDQADSDHDGIGDACETKTFHNVYSQSWGAARDIVQTKDGGYAVVTESNLSVSLIRLNAEGGVVWAKAYTDSTTSSQESIFWDVKVMETSDGGFILMAPKQYGQSYIAKVDAAGAILWQKVYDLFLDTLKIDADQNIIVRTANYAFTGGTSVALDHVEYIKLGEDGTQIWGVSVPAHAGDFAIDNDSGVLIVFNGTIAKLNSDNGTFQHISTLTPQNGTLSNLSAIYPKSTGGYIFVGTYSNPNAWGVVELDQDFHIINSNDYSSKGAESNEVFKLGSDDSRIFIFQSYYDPIFTPQLAGCFGLLKMDKYGSLLVKRAGYCSEDSDKHTAKTVTKDGGFIYADSFSLNQFRIVKLNPDGLLGGSCANIGFQAGSEPLSQSVTMQTTSLEPFAPSTAELGSGSFNEVNDLGVTMSSVCNSN